MSRRRFVCGSVLGVAGAIALVFLTATEGWSYAIGAGLLLLTIIGVAILSE